MQKADLEASFAELEGVRHFHARTLQGHIRSHQDRPEEAWELFDQAFELIPEAEESIPNLVRQFLLEAYRFQNAVLEAPIEPGTDFPPLTVPWVSDKVLQEYPEVRYVLLVRKSTEARLRLHTAEFDVARRLFLELRAENNVSHDLTSGEVSLGLAACFESTDDMDEALHELENASFVALSMDKTLNQAVLSARLAAFYGYLGDHERSNEWKLFLQRISPAPQATKDGFFKIALRNQQRCADLNRLVVL